MWIPYVVPEKAGGGGGLGTGGTGQKGQSGRKKYNKKTQPTTKNPTTTEHNQMARLTLLPIPYVQMYLKKHLTVRKFLTRDYLQLI